MFKWPDLPSARAAEHELADFAELVCWKYRIASQTAICADLNRLEENDYSEGVPEIPQVVEAAYEKACRGGYPYAIVSEARP